ncbi:TonB-dependent receptor [Brevundimonas subvibrioides]|uniref:TonB-dependent receptor n=1 Tax=Brevundimonas subvibrioides (strain ATCC 15264 / DSM 4735 / LMG 14903 / NBRC 16000 / CB 81) TaxID=633149 RepID=D9QJL9_BRESC|nr:TonB-dependent receptor [Brevundimonas subvibrioides]ADL01580.1 TonB-dependent receptor [Brevundimonas subvibrioides ATCC 15264]
MISTTLRNRALCAASALAMATLLSAGTASAQATTSTVRGVVSDGQTRESGGTVVAREQSTGFTYRGRVNADGSYVIVGIRPGSYEITATTTDGQTASDVVTLGVAQTGNLDLDVGGQVSADAGEGTAVGDIVVTGRRLAEVRTPENATNVTTQQIQTLPQINRNFLNFAALAPGVRVSQNETEVTITAGGQRAESINAFIDGASLKSNVIGGGIAGQDDSRGNPFPQAAIGEFRIITQNFKAEYEQASSAIITAVTRSGTNEFHGEIFGQYRDQSFISRDVFTRRAQRELPELEVQQYGAALGGPIIQDRLHFFGSYEHKQENRAAAVNLGRQTPAYLTQFAQYIGTFATPFEEDLYFGKLSFQPADGHLIDLSVTYRDEADTTSVGGANSFERASGLQQTTQSANLRYQWQGNGFVNEAAVDYRNYEYNPTASNFNTAGASYRVFDAAYDPFGGVSVINIGGSGSRQQITDETLTFRNDLTFTDFEFRGSHTIKLGVKFSAQNYVVDKEFGRNPEFFYDLNPNNATNASGNPAIPYRVQLGNRFPTVDLDNNVFGIYAQDDWQITDKLELNIGIRWDYEDNANNVEYVTPADMRTGLNQWIASTDGGKAAGYVPSWFNANDYFSTGSNREAFKDAYQPRIGFSYDVFGDRETVIFGGAGRYYDRVNFNFAFDEVAKGGDFTRNAFFSTTGRPAGVASGASNDPILWQASYFTAAGLDPVLNAIPAKGEAFLLKNDFEPPRTDQFNLGLRQRFGDWQTEFTLAYGKTENEFTWQYLNRCREPNAPNDGDGFGDNGGFCSPGGSNPYRTYLVSDHSKEREFTALYVKLDKNYTPESGWGLNIAYTLQDATQNGGDDNFCFDCFSVESSPMRNSPQNERHRIVANGIVDLPYDFQLSGILTLGSGTPFNVFDGTGSRFYYRPSSAYPDKENFLIPNAFAYRNLDLRLTKTIEVYEAGEVQLFVDAINVFNFDNYSGFDGGTGSAASPNPRFGNPSTVLFPTRTIQLGARFSF